VLGHVYQFLRLFDEVLHLARPQIDGEPRHRQFRRQPAAHQFALVDRFAQIGDGHPAGRRGPVIGPRGAGLAFDEGAGRQGFIALMVATPEIL
jgi:hypothetical protein